MDIEEHDFFREMTMRICSSLDIEVALERALEYLAKFIPVDAIFLHLYEQSLGAVRTIAEVKLSGSRGMEIITPLTRQGRESFEKPVVAQVRIVNRPETDVVVKKIAETLKLTKSSFLILRCVIEGKRVGSLTITANGRDRYTDEHARLLPLLNEPFAIALSNALRYQEVLRLKDLLTDDNQYLHQEMFRVSGSGIIGSAFGLQNVMEMVRKVATLESPVLLLGESGVGKGVIASVIHSLSPRRNGPFITVNSGAIPETLMDSELFGHERGAFTGAIEQKRGRFERANKGTIFLDEIGELSPQAQVRMLRVLQEKVIERVGGTKSIPVDIRIIAATHQNLQEMVNTKQFRKDLWFRINLFPIAVPPLRERKADIPSLVYHFISKKTKELKLPQIPVVAPGAIERLAEYNWPGNVRELENVVEREMILNRMGPLTFKMLVSNEAGITPSLPAELFETSLSFDELSASYIRQALIRAHGIVHGPRGAAAVLGINPSTLRSRMTKLGIPYGKKNKRLEWIGPLEGSERDLLT
jgi:transcriptional regulator with GAF, ATPase, and Fis domain